MQRLWATESLSNNLMHKTNTNAQRANKVLMSIIEQYSSMVEEGKREANVAKRSFLSIYRSSLSRARCRCYVFFY